MQLMLFAIFAFILVGLIGRRMGTREYAVIAAISTGMTMLYLLFGRRFM